MAHYMSTEKGLILWLADRFKDISEKLFALRYSRLLKDFNVN